MMPQSQTSLAEVADRIRRRAVGDWDALRDVWADEVVVWHCYDDVEERFTGLSRSSGGSAELEAFSEALEGFTRDSRIHVSPETETVVETSIWSGRLRSGTPMRSATCVVYTVRDGRIVRMDIYDDSNRSRRFAELLVHHLIAARAP
jgi:ketosteroid isomerase-like protein